jgi:glycyl-tRNA synthetase beta chain
MTMSQFLLELFSEEIPARLQTKGAEDLQRLMVAGLTARGLECGAAQSFATPRRLALVIAHVPPTSPAVSEEKKGPRVGAPDGAVQGFLKSAGLTSLDQALVVTDEKKGNFYVARIDKPGRAAADIIAETVTEVIAKFPWPKTQRWGASDVRWIRPLRSILCLYAGEVVPFTVGDVTSGNETRGHRFHGNQPFAVKNFDDYRDRLKANKVILDAADRIEAIRVGARAAAKAAKFDLIEDEGLLAENAGLTEWPTVLMGAFDESFLNVPPECLMTSMKQHQKCFSLTRPKDRSLANRFLLVSNLIATDDGKQIISGNEKVIAARLSDAKFFWDQDRQKTLTAMSHELAGITFHEKLGSQADRVERITELARQVAGSVDAEPDLAGRAAQQCKADLVSGMVGEFPELQGLMGRYLAEDMKENSKIAAAIEEHYKPRGAADTVPTEPVSVALALADKLDALVGFWAINERPTGSGDPYQLRRAALGVIRIVLENDLRVALGARIETSAAAFRKAGVDFGFWDGIAALDDELGQPGNKKRAHDHCGEDELASHLLTFFHERLKVYLRDQGARHDLIDAVLGAGQQDDLALIVKRVDALTDLLKTDDGANLLVGVKRASNILAIEEKKDKVNHAACVDAALLTLPEEKTLHAAITKVANDTRKAIDVERFDGAMRALAELRAPVDAFFDKVIVNDSDAKQRKNRLAILAMIRSATTNVADFSKIAG